MRIPFAGDGPDGDVAGESVQWREERTDQGADRIDLSAGDGDAELDWQPELDSALEAIDSCLPVKRRRSTDPVGTAFPRPEVSVLTFTPEVLDALAGRVAEKIKALQAPVPAPIREEHQMKPGAILTVRFRWPLFSFRSARYKHRLRARA